MPTTLSPEAAATELAWAAKRASVITRVALGILRAAATGLPPGPGAAALSRAAGHLNDALREIHAAHEG